MSNATLVPVVDEAPGGGTVTTLYRFFDGEGSLLYVGIAGNPGRRFDQHATEKNWWSQVATASMTHFSDRQQAADAEREAILAEKPRFNLKHIPKPPSQSQRVGVINLPIPAELHQRVNAARGIKGLKLREYVEQALREAVERDEAARGIGPRSLWEDNA